MEVREFVAGNTKIDSDVQQFLKRTKIHENSKFLNFKFDGIGTYLLSDFDSTAPWGPVFFSKAAQI